MSFHSEYNRIQAEVHKTAVSKGWWEKDRKKGEVFALFYSELMEALEYLRNGNGPDDKLTERLGVEVEMADTIIRIMDYSHHEGLDIAHSILFILKFNQPPGNTTFRTEFTIIQQRAKCHINNVFGFKSTIDSTAEGIANVVDFLSDGKRARNQVETTEYLAIAVMAIMEMASFNVWDIAGAILEKMEFNKTRAKKHGKEF